MNDALNQWADRTARRFPYSAAQFITCAELAQPLFDDDNVVFKMVEKVAECAVATGRDLFVEFDLIATALNKMADKP